MLPQDGRPVPRSHRTLTVSAPRSTRVATSATQVAFRKLASASAPLAPSSAMAFVSWLLRYALSVLFPLILLEHALMHAFVRQSCGSAVPRSLSARSFLGASSSVSCSHPGYKLCGTPNGGTKCTDVLTSLESCTLAISIIISSLLIVLRLRWRLCASRPAFGRCAGERRPRLLSPRAPSWRA
jgi:hypothetical protein